MKADIPFPKVEKVGICAVPSMEDDFDGWKVYILNLLEDDLNNVLISTRGYGIKDKSEVKTSQLRHYFEVVASMSAQIIEVIPKVLTGLNNQYWVSFYIDGVIYDKKFIFLPDTLLGKNLTDLPLLNQQGILII